MTCLLKGYMPMEDVHAVFITDSNGILIDADSDFCRITGYSPAELTAMGMADLLQADQWVQYKRNMCSICEKGMLTISISGLIDKNGTEHSAAVSIVRIPGNLFLCALTL